MEASVSGAPSVSARGSPPSEGFRADCRFRACQSAQVSSQKTRTRSRSASCRSPRATRKAPWRLPGAGGYSPGRLVSVTSESVLGSPDERHIRHRAALHLLQLLPSAWDSQQGGREANDPGNGCRIGLCSVVCEWHPCSVTMKLSHNPVYLVGLRQLTAPVILSDLAGKSHVLQ